MKDFFVCPEQKKNEEMAGAYLLWAFSKNGLFSV